MVNSSLDTGDSYFPFVFFDLGQTLITEWDFINHFDFEFLQLLNGYGARIDMRNYHAVRDSIIRNRGIGHESVHELAIQVCRAILPSGYENPILQRIGPKVSAARRTYFKIAPGAEETIRELTNQGCELGIIANQSKDINTLIRNSSLEKYFKVKIISDIVKIKKPDPHIFELALKEAGRNATQCVMVGDRLDTDICPANKLGMKTIRVTDSLFALQEPLEYCEHPSVTVANLKEIPKVVRGFTAKK